MWALNIRHVGSSTAEDLAEHFGNLDALSAATEEELQQVEGIGTEVAASLRAWFEQKRHRDLLRELKSLGVNPTQKKVRASNALDGKTIVVTGTLTKYKRDEVEALIKQHGGKTSGSVSKKTSYVLAGEEAGSKLEKARALGVPVIDETEFDRMIKG